MIQRLETSLSTAEDDTACYHEEDEGIQPDLEVKPTVFDLVAKRDAALDYTLRVIKKVSEMKKD